MWRDRENWQIPDIRRPGPKTSLADIWYIEERLLYWGGMAFFTCVSLAIFFLNTRHGIGIFVDSLRYMGISEKPFDAPLYAWLLSALTAIGASPEGGAKLIGVVLLCANTGIVWHLLARTTGKYLYAAAGTGIIVFSPQFVTLHASAMSEPLFIFCVMATLLTLLRYSETADRRWLLGSAIALAFAALTRFVAPALGVAIAAFMLIDPRRDLSRRVADVLIFGGISAVIFFAWVIASQITAGHSLGRELSLNGNMDAEDWFTSFQTLTVWLLPTQVPFSVRTLVFLSALGGGSYLLVWHGRRAMRARRTTAPVLFLPLVLGFFFLAYVGFMVIATSIEANLSLNSRYAFPVYVTCVIMLTIMLAVSERARGSYRLVHRALCMLAVVVLASHIVRTIDRTENAFDEGIGFAGPGWSQSAAILAASKLPSDAIIYSNGPEIITFILNRKARFLPERYRLRTGKEDPNNPLEHQVRTLEAAIAGREAYFIFLDGVFWRPYLETENNLKERFALEPVALESDGRIYRARELGSRPLP
ncbi:MAG: glycosyltransferase family 39 protein [Alphaproteobacteria bacterium]|nr:glycosyltransferase family 39 protein [Alphaproteobacteria bacterium]